MRYTQSVVLPCTNDRPVAEASTNTTERKYKSYLCPSARFKPTIPAIDRLQTYALHRRATEIGINFYLKHTHIGTYIMWNIPGILTVTITFKYSYIFRM